MSDDQCCRYCESTSDRDLIDSMARFVAALEANHRGDGDAFELLCESAGPLDYHSAVNLFIDLLNETGDYGIDPVASMEAMRRRVNLLAAEAD